MLTFNDLLIKAGLPLCDVRLVRHSDGKAKPGRSPYDLWRSDRAAFELYQRVQSKDRFAAVTWLASFVVMPLGESLFAGVYRKHATGVAPPGLLDPVRGHDVGGHVLYDLEAASALSEYAGRLIIEWGAGALAWHQRADRQDKPVLELRRTMHEPPFPGFLQFQSAISALATVPTSWRAALAAVSGVYLLVDLETGRQYVGSATGEGGFWARWESYAQSGHGGNEGMKPNPNATYQVTILELASSSATQDEVLRLEARWKDKFLSRRFGLNQN